MSGVGPLQTRKRLIPFGLLILSFCWGEVGFSYSANKVWFEFRDRGTFRVYVNYTVPELKEFREAYVDFRSRAKAEKFYWDLVRGADFFAPNSDSRRFTKPPLEPDPW